MRNGYPPWFKSVPPKYVKPQRVDKEHNGAIKSKLEIDKEDKGYIGPGFVLSLTGFFAVPKGPTDVQLVYDASASGLNGVLWAPTFALPGAHALLDIVTPSSWMGDLDMGEQFLNFTLHSKLQQFCGIDVRPYFGSVQGQTAWLRWTKCMMGLLTSPYYAVKGTHLAEETAWGDPLDPIIHFNGQG
jgi:hypothetical protein